MVPKELEFPQGSHGGKERGWALVLEKELGPGNRFQVLNTSSDHLAGQAGA